MKAVQFNRSNGISFQQAEIASPQLNDDHVLVKVEQVGLSFIDAKIANNHDIAVPDKVFGVDAAGRVEKSCKTGFPERGSRVFWHGDITSAGVMSEYVSVPSHALTVLPPKVDTAMAAATLAPAMSAFIALFKLQLNSGDTIMVESAHLPVGQMALQFAKQQGITVVASTTPEQQKLVRSLGADAVYTAAEFSGLADFLSQQLGIRELDGVIDLTAQHTEALINQLVFCGRVSCVGGLPSIQQTTLMAKAPNIGIVSLCGSWLSNSICAQQRMAFVGDALAEKLSQGEITLPNHSKIQPNHTELVTALAQLAQPDNDRFFSVSLKF